MGKAPGKDFMIQSLKDDGAASVLIACGLPQPMRESVFDGLEPNMGFGRRKIFQSCSRFKIWNVCIKV